ncbi:hypothetical protein A946_07400 [Methylacidiphilum kamchatkense Kam1]|uniref:Uncharacterized protein n=1 Tax=Methylacidiphilum kamchatkense Kam1 TaxID=1202785 RepID=A0ABR4ZVP7_9BACT|nr:hypothetical protein A946_07400 [Methylacidiphilum kamchatkense Kam1]
MGVIILAPILIRYALKHLTHSSFPKRIDAQWPSRAANAPLCRLVVFRVQRSAGIVKGALRV